MKLDLSKLKPARHLILDNAKEALAGSGAPDEFFGSLVHKIANDDKANAMFPEEKP